MENFQQIYLFKFFVKNFRYNLAENFIKAKGQIMLRYLFIAVLAVFISACGSKSTSERVAKVVSEQNCYSCDDPRAFEAKIQGLLYVSDIGIRCCADKRTLDKSVAIKKIYIHSVKDLDEEDKIFHAKNQTLIINEKFNAVFYNFLRQELQARGMIVIEGINNSPYVMRVDVDFLSFNASLDNAGLHSNLSARLTLKYFNIGEREFVVRTKQDVMGFSDESEISFYTYLLLKQLANKTAAQISKI